MRNRLIKPQITLNSVSVLVLKTIIDKGILSLYSGFSKKSQSSFEGVY